MRLLPVFLACAVSVAVVYIQQGAAQAVTYGVFGAYGGYLRKASVVTTTFRLLLGTANLFCRVATVKYQLSNKRKSFLNLCNTNRSTN
ncbi:hypothetical protein DPMN_098178 [Dreissena polymorpha]|uniref:Secreted protein n=1 Tax=Dreissena polymorpha TaxID=45954 RepID=A0A9D4LBU5_DREPO|nr:hypothetical protein DPMN_098178 [Dreissena polymorpha]